MHTKPKWKSMKTKASKGAGHTFWNKENQCWLQNLHCHCVRDKNKISRMTKDKRLFSLGEYIR